MSDKTGKAANHPPQVDTSKVTSLSHGIITTQISMPQQTLESEPVYAENDGEVLSFEVVTREFLVLWKD